MGWFIDQFDFAYCVVVYWVGVLLSVHCYHAFIENMAIIYTIIHVLDNENTLLLF